MADPIRLHMSGPKEKTMNAMRYVVLTAALGSAAVMAVAQAKPQKLTGWIGESKCGAANHDAACVKKCISAGAKPVFVDADKKVWMIDNTDAVQNYYGDHVKVMAIVDTANSSIHIAKVKKDKM